MKTWSQFLESLSRKELEKQYDDLERQHGLNNKPNSQPKDLEDLYGKEVRDSASNDLIYGKSHRPGIDFVKDPAHEQHPLHNIATEFGYRYSGSHLVQGRPFHIYVFDQPTKAVGVNNIGLTTDQHGLPVWSMRTRGSSHVGGRDASGLKHQITSHLRYVKSRNRELFHNTDLQQSGGNNTHGPTIATTFKLNDEKIIQAANRISQKFKAGITIEQIEWPSRGHFHALARGKRSDGHKGIWDVRIVGPTGKYDPNGEYVKFLNHRIKAV